MILTKEIEMKWTGKTAKLYLTKGYPDLEYGETFKVKIADLPDGSQAKIKVQCSHCRKVYDRAFRSVNSALNSITGKYFCMGCMPHRMKATMQAKQDAGLLERGNEGYWTFKENIEKEILLHIERYGKLVA